MEGNLTLTELNALVKESLQRTFPNQLWIVAEIAEMKVNRTGHCYLELVEKDQSTDEITAKARATIWSWQFRFIQPYFESSTGQALSSGLKVLVSVTVEFHEVYGYSLNIKDIDPTYTLGDMARKRMEIIARLTEEGVIDMNRELPLPDLPSRIAIVSSSTAAGYGDFMNQLAHNSAGYKFYTKLFQATLQGNDAPASIMEALDTVYEYDQLFDIVVIVRGGGSQLDLNCFDDYDLALHVAQFPLPVLTGIGHEKDDTIVDRVAHTKLKTPTAVAEFLIGKFDEIAEEIEAVEESFWEQVNDILKDETQRIGAAVRLLKPVVKGKLERSSIQLSHVAKSVKPLISDTFEEQQFRLVNLSVLLSTRSRSSMNRQWHYIRSFSTQTSHLIKFSCLKERQLIHERQQRMKHATGLQFSRHRNRLALMGKTLSLVNPEAILKRGFSITLKNGKVLKDAREIEAGDHLEHILYRGKIATIVENIKQKP